MSMALPQPSRQMIARAKQPLIAIPIDRDGEAETHYFVDEAAADAALARSSRKRPIKLAGVWQDLDEEEMLASLARIRHASTPTPPIEDL